MTPEPPSSPTPPPVVRQPVGPRLRMLLVVVFGFIAVLGVNSVYLLAVRGLEWQTGRIYQNLFYLQMFLLHLVLGILLVLPMLIFVGFHIRNTYRRRNRRAVNAGFALFGATLVLLISGIVLTRIEGLMELNHPTVRSIAFGAHVFSPLFVIWLYVLHRLAGRRIRWRMGATWAAIAVLCAVFLVLLQMQDPRAWNVVGPRQGMKYFYPSLARTSTGNFISANVLSNDQYCLECHAEVHETWANSSHRFSSFNNPAYLFSVANTREQMMQRHGNVQGARFCAGCHDPVPFFSGAFDDPKYDDPNFDLASDAQAQAGITCTVCHAISHINSPRGNADYTIDEPIHYPFTFSENGVLRWVNRQLVKAKPQFHKATFLKPLHKSTEFCGTCHKVHLPRELNDYRWLRGQNHYDSFWLSGVSGHSVQSFYYPAVADENCNRCHMPQVAVQQSSEQPNFGAAVRDPMLGLSTSSHLFPGANTAVPYLLRDSYGDAERAIDAHREILEDCVRVDIFGIREDGKIDGRLHALADTIPVLQPGKTYLLQIVLRTLTLGHHLTQGTSDSNELWMDVAAEVDGQILGRSGGLRAEDNSVDPWSHFVNSFVIDRDGNRINRRNAEDIFVALYNNQIPPGAADVVNYKLRVPEDAQGTIRIRASLKYRKFDTEFLRYVESNSGYVNDLPIITLGSQEIRLPVAGEENQAMGERSPVASATPAWERWNDYGIGLLRRGQLRQAESAFQRVEGLGNSNGPLNLARVYLAEGRVTSDAPAALRRAREVGGGAADWSILWFSALVNKQLGEVESAIANLEQIVDGGFEDAMGRGFDFSKDYRLLNELADSLYLRALRDRGASHKERREQTMKRARDIYQRTLELDPENADAHYGIRRVYEQLGREEQATVHDRLHKRYKLDDNARDAAIAAARQKYPAANQAAERVVIVDLQRVGAYGLPP